MTILQRIGRYLLIWLALFVILCVVSVIRHWDSFTAVLGAIFQGWLHSFLYLSIIGGILLYMFWLLIRPLFR